jgi:hypothetical protein
MLQLKGLRWAGVALALVAIAPGFSGCSGSPSPTPATGQPASGGDDGGQNVALAAFEAIFSGDKNGFLKQVRPDETPRQAFEQLFQQESARVAGCKSEGAQLLVERRATVNPGNQVTIVFGQPCGVDLLGYANRKCWILLTQLTGRWYVDGAESWSCSS